ncbi:class I SAM-dependent methyltransferase [Gemmata sp.]|uniref:class I SAM-dependent methyltransferase n=1 Tax=Gemmata sp. TaxID=1914242 RepID=UPI003F6F46AE
MSEIATKTGHYYEKQLNCKSSVIAWSHGARFQTARRLIGTGPVGQLLDYGCGDGTFLAMVADRVGTAVGADVAADQLRDCAERFADRPGVRFAHVRDLAAPEHAGAYDVVTCMETLEHCPTPVVEVVLADLGRLCKPGGRVVISVPVETGPPFLLKYAVRTAAAWRGLSDYRYYETYTPLNALKMLTAGKGTTLPRPVYGPPGAESLSHYGFNWRALRERVRHHLTLDATHFSPLGWLGGLASSQAWFVCRPKGAA